MRNLALLTLVAASASAATYTNSFGTSDPALQFVTNGPEGQAWSTSGPYATQKPWDVTVSDGSVRVSGWASLPQSYVNTYPGAAGAGAATFSATTNVTGLSTFKISDISQISVQLSANETNTAPTSLQLWLVTAGGKAYQLFQLNSSVAYTRSGPGNTGDYIQTFSNIVFSSQYQNPSYTFSVDDEYVGLKLGSSAYFNGMYPARDQFLDLTLQSVSITTPGGGAIPEPSTYGLALGGLALAVVAARRRAKRA